MGSFNTTCFASMQTIASGDKCFIIPIIAQSGYSKVNISKNDQSTTTFSVANTTCYANAFWKPIGRIISAEYDDYGRVIIDKTDRNKKIIIELLKALKTHLYKTEEGSNKYHDLPFDPANIDLEKPFESLDNMWDVTEHEYRVFYCNYLKQPVQFTFAIISKEAADYLFNKVNNFRNWEDKSYNVEDKIIEMEQSYKSYFDDEDDKSNNFNLFLFKFNDYFDRGEGYFSFSHFYLRDIIEEQKDKPFFTDTTKEIIRDLFYERYVFSGFEWLNIKIYPMIYASQDYSNEIGKDYAKFVNSVSSAICKNRKSYYDEFEEEDFREEEECHL